MGEDVTCTVIRLCSIAREMGITMEKGGTIDGVRLKNTAMREEELRLFVLNAVVKEESRLKVQLYNAYEETLRRIVINIPGWRKTL